MYAMTQAWTEGTGNGSATGDGATWNTYNGSTAWPGGAGGASDKGSTVLANFAATATGSYQVSLNAAGVAVLENWINTPANNKGFMIYAGSRTNGLDLTSKEGTTVGNRPKLDDQLLPSADYALHRHIRNAQRLQQPPERALGRAELHGVGRQPDRATSSSPRRLTSRFPPPAGAASGRLST